MSDEISFVLIGLMLGILLFTLIMIPTLMNIRTMVANQMCKLEGYEKYESYEMSKNKETYFSELICAPLEEETIENKII